MRRTRVEVVRDNLRKENPNPRKEEEEEERGSPWLLVDYMQLHGLDLLPKSSFHY